MVGRKEQGKKYSAKKVAWQQNIPVPFFHILYHG
jgi:hypothetical protein